MKNRFTQVVMLLSALFFIAASGACSKKESSPEAAAPQNSKGIGPVQSITVGALDPATAAKGEQIFKSKCAACHKMDERYVGPALKGITGRRAPEWIMNMILNPQEMTQKDPVAKELLATYFTQMTFQNVSQEESRSILEYFRQIDGKK